MINKYNYSSVMCPKDTGSLIRSIESTLQKCEQAIQRMQNVPRWSPDPDLVKKYNLIEFL